MLPDNFQDKDRNGFEPNLEAQIVPIKLQEIARQVHENNVEVQETVRTLLTWFGAKRRGFYVINSIQKALAEVRLTRAYPEVRGVLLSGERLI